MPWTLSRKIPGRIIISRENGEVRFEEISINLATQVFWLNCDPQAEHWPCLPEQKMTGVPMEPGSPVSQSDGVWSFFRPAPPFRIEYRCAVPGHEHERGVVNVYGVFGPNVVPDGALPLGGGGATLPAATVGQPYPSPPLTLGGKPPFVITILSGELPPGLQLVQSPGGLVLQGTPAAAGVFTVTLRVLDNLNYQFEEPPFSVTVLPGAPK